MSKNDLAILALSFLLAFIAIRHGAEILKSVTSLGTWVFGFLGIVG